MLTNVISLFCGDRLRLLKVPKLVVVVDKDDTGKVWNYIFTEDAIRNQNSFGTASLWIHNSGSPENSLERVRPIEPIEESRVTLGILPQHEEARAHARIKKK